MMKACIIILALGALLALGSCKTSEKNYREAYNLVMEKKQRDAAQAAEDLDPAAMARPNERQQGRTAAYAIGTDTLQTRIEHVRRSDFPGNPAEPQMERFCIVAGQFRQLFNAKSLMGKLRESGYEAFIVESSKPEYYVIAATTSMAAAALEDLAALKSDPRQRLLPPCPYVLQPAKLMR